MEKSSIILFSIVTMLVVCSSTSEFQRDKRGNAEDVVEHVNDWIPGIVRKLSKRQAAGAGDTADGSGEAGGQGSDKLTDADARAQLSAAGISVNKPSPATSLNNVRTATISGIISFKESCGCTVVVTAGTEPGHAAGTKSHANGYKLDIRLNSGVNNFIQTNYQNIGLRSDGAQQYKSPAGFIFAREGNHWDILFP